MCSMIISRMAGFEDISVVFQILGRGDRFTATRSIMHIIEVTPPSSSNDVTRPSLAFFLHLCDDDKCPKHHYSTANYTRDFVVQWPDPRSFVCLHPFLNHFETWELGPQHFNLGADEGRRCHDQRISSIWHRNRMDA